MKFELKYSDLFEFAEADSILTTSGRAWRGLIISSKKVLLTSEKEINNIAETLRNAPIQVDHSKNVRDTVGRVSESSKDGDSVLYRGRVHDKEIAQKIKDGLIGQCSVSLSADKIEENFTYQGEEGWTALTGCSVIELSLVLRGAVAGNSVFPEFSFSVIEDEASDLEIEPEVESFDQTLKDLAILKFDELKKKYDQLLIMFEETNSTLNSSKKELYNLNKRYEYLLSTGEEMDEKYADFDEKLVLLIAELRNEVKNSRIMGTVNDDIDTPDLKELAKEDLRKMIFDTNNSKKDLKSFSDWRKKYNLQDNM